MTSKKDKDRVRAEGSLVHDKRQWGVHALLKPIMTTLAEYGALFLKRHDKDLKDNRLILLNEIMHEIIERRKPTLKTRMRMIQNMRRVGLAILEEDGYYKEMFCEAVAVTIERSQGKNWRAGW